MDERKNRPKKIFNPLGRGEFFFDFFAGRGVDTWLGAQIRVSLLKAENAAAVVCVCGYAGVCDQWH